MMSFEGINDSQKPSSKMLTNAAAKRSRATNEQLSFMVDFFINNPGLAGGKFQKLHGKFESDKKWSELTEVLNSLGGAVKTVEQWHTVWKDLKSRTSVKVRDRKKQQALTGNKPISLEPVTELEQRVVALIGKDYIEGHCSVRENVPMNEEHQLLLEDGVDFVLEFPPSPPEQSNKRLAQERTPRRTPKRRREEEYGETKKRFEEIANKQADALKMLAASSAENVEALKTLGNSYAAAVEVGKMMANAIDKMGDALKSTADAFNTLAAAINRL